MKYELNVRSRAQQSESIPEKHERFFAELSKIPLPWGIGGAAIPPPPDPKSNLGAGVSFSKSLGRGIFGRAYYVYRRDFKDIAMHDDFFDMSFNPVKVDYKQLVCEVLPKFITAFNAYYAEIADREFIYIDFDAERAAGLGDARSGIYRIRPISFFDKVLTQRAFGLSPDEVVKRLEGHVEKVAQLNNGVYIIGSSQPLKLEAADKLCWDLKRLLLAA